MDVSRNATTTGIRLKSPVKAKVRRYKAKNSPKGNKAHPLILWPVSFVFIIQVFVIEISSEGAKVIKEKYLHLRKTTNP
jgi:hypothetical protein